MRFAISSSVFTLVTAVLASAADVSINPPLSVLQPIATSNQPAQPIVGRMTNAKRLAMNLPPLRPKSLHRGSRANTAPRSSTSMTPPVAQKCGILVKDAVTRAPYGFVRKEWNPLGEYGLVEEDTDAPVVITFYASVDDSSPSQLDFIPDSTPNTAYPYVGASVGFVSNSNSFSPDSANYAYITATTQTPAGSPPRDDASNSFTFQSGIPVASESAVWKYNPTTREITAQWVNPDNSLPDTFIVYANDGNNALLLTGSPATLLNAFGVSYATVTLTCVDPATLPTQEQ